MLVPTVMKANRLSFTRYRLYHRSEYFHYKTKTTPAIN